jgi:hypothetical protein
MLDLKLIIAQYPSGDVGRSEERDDGGGGASPCALAGCGRPARASRFRPRCSSSPSRRPRDSQTLCDQVWPPRCSITSPRSGCPATKAMQIFFDSVHDPTLAVGRVVVNGKNKAEAITLSTAKGQLGSLDALELVNTSGGWRVSGLGSPLLPWRGEEGEEGEVRPVPASQDPDSRYARGEIQEIGAAVEVGITSSRAPPAAIRTRPCRAALRAAGGRSAGRPRA